MIDRKFLARNFISNVMALPVMLFMLCNFNTANGQQYLIKNFSGTQYNKGIVLNFTLVMGNTCFDTEIQRSTDGKSFTTIGTIAGFCGSTQTDVTYSYTDEAPIPNSENHYRINLPSLGLSEVIKIKYIDFSASNALVVYNASAGALYMYYNNTSHKPVTFRLLNSYGGMLTTYTGIVSEWTIPLERLRAGIYIVTFTFDTHTISRKVAVN